jgi:hypothetical protein
MKLAYWDEDAYVTELTVSTGEPDKTNGSGGTNSKSKYENAAVAETEGLIKPAKEGEKSKKRKADSAAIPSTKKVISPLLCIPRSSPLT